MLNIKGKYKMMSLGCNRSQGEIVNINVESIIVVL